MLTNGDHYSRIKDVIYISHVGELLLMMLEIDCYHVAAIIGLPQCYYATT